MLGTNSDDFRYIGGQVINGSKLENTTMVNVKILKVFVRKKRIFGRITSIKEQKRTKRFILGNPYGEENPTKLPLYRIQPNTM